MLATYITYDISHELVVTPEATDPAAYIAKVSNRTDDFRRVRNEIPIRLLPSPNSAELFSSRKKPSPAGKLIRRFFGCLVQEIPGHVVEYIEKRFAELDIPLGDQAAFEAELAMVTHPANF